MPCSCAHSCARIMPDPRPDAGAARGRRLELAISIGRPRAATGHGIEIVLVLWYRLYTYHVLRKLTWTLQDVHVSAVYMLARSCI